MSAEEYSKKAYSEAEDYHKQSRGYLSRSLEDKALDEKWRLLSKAQEEAVVKNREYNRARNPEYNRLLEVAETALKAVEDFEKEKLNKSEGN